MKKNQEFDKLEVAGTYDITVQSPITQGETQAICNVFMCLIAGNEAIGAVNIINGKPERTIHFHRQAIVRVDEVKIL